MENIDSITTIGLALLTLVFPYLAPVKYAKYVNLIGGVIRGTKVVVDALDRASKRIEDSKGGFSSELAKEVVIESAKDIALKKLNEVVNPDNKSDMITERDFKKIGDILVKSKGMIASASKIKDFLKAL